MQQKSALRQQNHRQKNAYQGIERIFMPYAMEFSPGRVQTHRGIIQNVGKIWILVRRPGVTLSVAPQYHRQSTVTVSRKFAISRERLFAQIWAGNQKRDWNAPDRDIEWTQATLRAGLRSQMSITPLPNATTQHSSRAQKRFALRTMR
jgi:hypothetical protein